MNRCLDCLGRIVIPMEIRKSLKINTNDLISIKVVGNRIILEKIDNSDELFVKELLENIESFKITGNFKYLDIAIDVLKERL